MRSERRCRRRCSWRRSAGAHACCPAGAHAHRHDPEQHRRDSTWRRRSTAPAAAELGRPDRGRGARSGQRPKHDEQEPGAVEDSCSWRRSAGAHARRPAGAHARCPAGTHAHSRDHEKHWRDVSAAQPEPTRAVQPEPTRTATTPSSTGATPRGGAAAPRSLPLSWADQIEAEEHDRDEDQGTKSKNRAR